VASSSLEFIDERTESFSRGVMSFIDHEQYPATVLGQKVDRTAEG
jgi:hypothetical protein